MSAPLIPESHPLYKTLYDQIHTIADEVQASGSLNEESYGLLGGKAGATIFYTYLYKAFNESKYFDIASQYVDELNEALATQEMPYLMSSGVAGVAYVFQHLRNIGFLDTEDDLNLKEVDEFIAEATMNDYMQGNWDPLHGLTGLGVYFLERHKEDDQSEQLARIVDYLDQMRRPAEEHKLWVSAAYTIDDYNSPECYNFGMAHGMPGVISLLAQIHLLGIQQEKIAEIINDVLGYLLKGRLPDELPSAFPSRIVTQPEDGGEKDTHARLGWCYGDFGMINAMLHAGRALNRQDWIDEAEKLTHKTALRDKASASCSDAEFCHGAVGIIHQYLRIFQRTGNEAFKQAALNWLDITLAEFYKPDTGLGGYSMSSYDSATKTSVLKDSPAFLDGSIGVALVYLWLITGTDPAWDNMYFTNVQ
jgi:lantibiotic biosynthesis protein